MTLRRGEREGHLLPNSRTRGDWRYDPSRLGSEGAEHFGYKMVAYLRVSNQDQKDDLKARNKSLNGTALAKVGHAKSWPTSDRD